MVAKSKSVRAKQNGPLYAIAKPGNEYRTFDEKRYACTIARGGWREGVLEIKSGEEKRTFDAEERETNTLQKPEVRR